MTRRLIVSGAAAAAGLVALVVWDRLVHVHWPCMLCGKPFEGADELSAHLTDAHGIPAEQVKVLGEDTVVGRIELT